MKTNKWLIWLVILLIVMNVSAVFTIFYQNWHESRTEENSTRAVTTESAGSMRYSGRWFRDELGLTGQQMKEFSGFNPAFRQKVRDINIELARKKQRMLEELASENSDTVQLNRLSDSIGDLHSELKKATYLYFLEFKKICTPGQQEKLNAVFSSIFEGEMPAGGPGRGMQGGRRNGMRWGN